MHVCNFMNGVVLTLVVGHVTMFLNLVGKEKDRVKKVKDRYRKKRTLLTLSICLHVLLLVFLLESLMICGTVPTERIF